MPNEWMERTRKARRPSLSVRLGKFGREGGVMRDQSAVDNPLSADGPRSLPFCAYPQVRDVTQHGVQVLPAVLPLVDFARAQPYRSRQYTAVAAARLTPAQVLHMAEVVGTSFAQREPQTRYLQPPKYPPAGLMEARHTDPFGSDTFGPWTKERLLYWFIRLLVLTDPTRPKSAMQINEETLTQSLAVVDQTGHVIGGALNETMPPLEASPVFRQDDPFLTAVFSFVTPILTLLSTQDAEALTALRAQYPAFRAAYAQGKVGHHFMVARRSEALAKADTFELVAASAAHYQAPSNMRIWSSKRPIRGPVRPAKCSAAYVCILRPTKAGTRYARAQSRWRAL
jgi:hypothetical protein